MNGVGVFLGTVPKVGVVRMVVNRLVVNLHTKSSGTQSFEQRTSMLGVLHPERVQVPPGSHPIEDDGTIHTREFAKRGLVAARNVTSAGDEVVEPGELAGSESTLKVGEPIVIAE